MARMVSCLAMLALAFVYPWTSRARVPDLTKVLIDGVPHIRQKPDFCGEACAAMALAKLGFKLGADQGQDFVFDESGLDPLEGRGCHTRELARALEAIGFRTGKVWRSVPARDAGAALEDEWSALHSDLQRGVPSIVCMRYAAGTDAPEHFRLVLGHDPARDEVIYHEPAEDSGSYRRMARRELLDLWPLKYEKEQWTVIRLRLEPGDLKVKPARAKFTGADYAQHIRELKKKLPGSGFSVVLSPPFVVAGDEDAATVRMRAESTVRWAVERLKKSYFPSDPDEILDIWLFKDRASYEKNARQLFGQAPTTPFGYYSAEHRALVMNIATGGGTLVHEIVHPFMRSNFPGCPAWFNEGLASLYEQSSERDGRIVGLTNWRLEGLQQALRAGKVPAFAELLATTEHEFYREDRGTNYAQARYLCYYLQEKGLLESFYRELVRSRLKDPGGFAALKKVVAKTDDEMPAFQKEWEAFVLGLKFP